MRKFFNYAALGLVLFCVFAAATPLFAQENIIAPVIESPVISPSSFWFDIWQIVQPVVVMFLSTVVPAFGIWLAAQVSSLLKITDEKRKLEVEAQLRNALHESAINALKYALNKVGSPSISGQLSQEVIETAIGYVRDKNPETLEKLGVREGSLEQIILSKVQDVTRIIPKI